MQKLRIHQLLLLFLFAYASKVFSQAPSNDLICGAIQLSPGIPCTQGTNTNATSTAVTGSACITGTINDVWYYFVATDATMTISTDYAGGTLTDTEMAVYSSSDGTCTGTLTHLICDDDGGNNVPNTSNIFATGYTVGNTYFVRIDGSAATTGTFCIRVSDSYIPGSVPCEAQQVFDNSAACSATNGNIAYNATTYWPNAVGANYCGCDNETAQQGTWSTFTANSTSTTISNQTAGANQNPLDISLFTGSCSSLSCVSCTSIAKGGSTTLATTVGTTYYVLTTLQSGSTSEFRSDICIQGTAGCTAPANNACASATSISENTVYTTSTYCATADDALCVGSNENNIWYSWTAPVGWTGAAYFQMYNQNCTGGDISGGSQVSIYTGGQTCATTSTCEASSSFGTDTDVSVSWTPTAGTTYLITFDGFGGEVCQLSFQLSNSPVVVLPVETSYFTATPKDGKVFVNWGTTKEVNNKYFSIERSTDAINFESIGTVNGAVNSNENNDYSFFDNNPFNGTSYYRIKQVDINGKFSYTPPEKVTIIHKIQNEFVFYPNPSKNRKMNFSYLALEDQVINMSIFTLQGTEVMSKNYSFSAGSQIENIDFTDLQPGIYIAKLNFTNETKFAKLMVD